MMDDYTFPFWIYLGVLAVFVGGAMKRLLASHLGAAPPLVAWLGATVLAERLWSICLPAALLLALLGLACCLYSATKPGPAPPGAALPAHGKAVLITGCDSGFGTATAKHLDNLGFEVFATVLDLSGEGARELERSCSPRLTLLQVDITQQQQVHQALLDTKAKLGLKGDQPFPCLAAYGASKAALNLLVNTLRHELEPWGVKVCTILPSSFKTGQSSNRAYWEQQHKQLLRTLPPALLEEYGEDYLTETKELFHRYASQANTDLSPVTDTIARALLAPRPRARYFAGPGVGLMYFIHSYCPLSLSSRFLQKLFLKKRLAPRALRNPPGFDPDLGLNNNNNNNNKEEEEEVEDEKKLK
ncbi:11-beta-hydroxysteroid dehydrogenase type 2 isoform X3 [Pungitius pungitius]|uniref:11-beta-hydroxysteroid dehydrogenase type 2 isoform X3 n=1 Tax=Pungitius pungitius TaxID=134920 RepID=UPI002E149E85